MPDDLADHVAAAAVLKRVATQALERAVVAGGSGLTESALQQEVVDALHAGGLEFDHPPIVGFGPNAANPHYEPRAGADRALARDEVVLLDLWGGRRLGAVYADQTWMGFSGARPPAEVLKVWETVRDARDAAIEFVQDGLVGGAAPARLRGGPGGAGGHRQARGTGRRSSIAPGTRSTTDCMARVPIWTTTRPTTTGSSCPERGSRSSRACT